MRNMRRWIGVSLVGILLGTGVAMAQTSPATTTTQTGAFDQLSPGNQQIARALFEAQTPTPGTTPLTLNQIAARKQSGQGWGEVFKEMKAQGLVQDKNLGQVVSQFNLRHRTAPPLVSHRHGTSMTSPGTVITTANGRTQVVGARGPRDGAGPARFTSRGEDGSRGDSGASVAHGGSRGNAFGHEASEAGGLGHSGGGFSHGGRGR